MVAYARKMGLIIVVTNMQKTKRGQIYKVGIYMRNFILPKVALNAHENQLRMIVLLIESHSQPLIEMT